MGVRSIGPAARRARLIVPAIGLALLCTLLGAPPAIAADTTPPTLVDIRISTAAVTVTGLSYKVVTIAVHLTDETGVSDVGDEEELPRVGLSRVGGRGDVRRLTLVTGTPTDGEWTAKVLVPATYHGSWRVSNVSALDVLGNALFVDPATLGIVRTLQVTGIHQPRLTVGTLPSPATLDQTITVRGRLTYRDTMRPIPGRVLIIGWGERCFTGGDRVITDRNGYYRFQIPRSFQQWEIWPCLHLVAPVPTASEDWSFDPDQTAQIAFRIARPVLRALVRARPERRSVAVGGRILIVGNVRPYSPFERVLLWRWTASRGWIVERSAVISMTSRFQIYARPPARGTFRYRVSKPSRPPYLVHGASPVMLLTAT